MTLCVESGMFHLFPKCQMFVMIRQAGYRFVELHGRHDAGKTEKVHFAELGGRAATNPRWAAELRQELADAGLTAVGAFVVHPIAVSDESVRRTAVERWQRTIAAAAELGLKLITTELTGDRAKPAEGESQFRKSMEQILPWLEQANIHLSVEPHTGDFYEQALPTIKLLRSFNSRHLGYLHVTPHTFYLGAPPRQIIREAGKLLTHVYVADTLRPERFMIRGNPISPHLHAIPGTGDVDFRETFEALAEIGYKGYVSVQLLSHRDRPMEAAAKAREYLQNLLGEKLLT